MRQQKEAERRSRDELKRKAEQSIVNVESEFSSTSEDTENPDDVEQKDPDPSDPDFCLPTTSTILPRLGSHVRIGASEVVSASIASALDRTNMSDRKAAFLLTAAAQTYSNHQVSELSVSVSSICRARAMRRSQQSTISKVEFKSEGPLVIHFDSKRLPHITGGAEKQDRVAILVTGYGAEKLLGVPSVNAGTGKEIPQAAQNAILDWKIEDKIAGMCFDTTASNRGHLNGACVILEGGRG